jgi:hypothetical protein
MRTVECNVFDADEILAGGHVGHGEFDSVLHPCAPACASNTNSGGGRTEEFLGDFEPIAFTVVVFDSAGSEGHHNVTGAFHH